MKRSKRSSKKKRPLKNYSHKSKQGTSIKKYGSSRGGVRL